MTAAADSGFVPREGLCPGCAHVLVVETDRSRFLRCGLARSDPRYPKYPPQPVVRCTGHRPNGGP